MPQGKKTCPNCKEMIGARTQLCDCGWHYSSGKVMPDLLKEKKEKAEAAQNPSAGKKGIKLCKGCGNEIGAPTQLCKICGYHYPSGKIRQDLLNAVVEKVVKTYSGPGRGIKQCGNPKCKIYIGGRNAVCPKCGFDFTVGKTEKAQAKEDAQTARQEKRNHKHETEVDHNKISAKTAEILKGISRGTIEVSPSIKPSHRENAEQLFEESGDDHVKFMNFYRKKNKCWTHIDWKYVEKRLGIESEDAEENAESEV